MESTDTDERNEKPAGPTTAEIDSAGELSTAGDNPGDDAPAAINLGDDSALGVLPTGWRFCGLEKPHGRHLIGGADAMPVTCPGADAPTDDLGTYVAMFDQYRADQRHWLGAAQLPLVFHIRKLCAKLDADPEAPASLSSAYLQALHRLERQRPGSKEPAGAGGDLPGQASIFDDGQLS